MNIKNSNSLISEELRIEFITAQEQLYDFLEKQQFSD